jgi:hypothetical protein
MEPQHGRVYVTTDIYTFDPFRWIQFHNELVDEARELAPELFANRSPSPVPNNIIPFSYPSDHNTCGRRYIDPRLVTFAAELHPI